MTWAGRIGTSPTRFIALFSRPTCPLILASSSSADEAAAERVTQEQEQEREHYAAYVWRMVVDLQVMSVGLIGKGAPPRAEAEAEAEGEAVLDPALLTSGEAGKTSELEVDTHDLMALKDRYGDKVVLRASEAEVMNALTGSYVRVRLFPAG